MQQARKQLYARFGHYFSYVSKKNTLSVNNLLLCVNNLIPFYVILLYKSIIIITDVDLN